MKKVLSVAIVITFCLFSFFGCASKEYCYVSYVSEEGFVADIGEYDRVFVKYANADESIHIFDTVVVKFDADDIKEISGTYTDNITGNPSSYSYVLENVKSVRQSNPKIGEPIYG